jgi:hypothetical protein
MRFTSLQTYSDALYPEHLTKIEQCLSTYPTLAPWPPFNDVNTPSVVLNILFHYISTEQIENPSQIKYAIETGTHNGQTAMHLSGLLEKVFTVEKYPQSFGMPYYKKIKETFNNIELYGGDAHTFIGDILKQYPEERFIFWLDAHNGTEEVPLLEEIAAIRDNSKCKNHVIMIDDGHDMGHGVFPSFDVLEDAIKQINSNYNLTNTKYGRDIAIALL